MESTPTWMSGLLEATTRAIELVGVAVIVLGAVYALWRLLGGAHRDAGHTRYHGFRSDLGRAILLGLEFLVAADIIGTVAVNPTLDTLAVLGLIVLIRTFLSFSLQVEIEGKLPWDRRADEGQKRQKV